MPVFDRFRRWYALRQLRARRRFDLAAATAFWSAIAALILTVVGRIPPLRAWLGLEGDLTEAAVGFAALLIVFLYMFRNEVKEDTTRLLNRLEGADFRIFQTSDEQVLYMASRINTASRSVCDVSWVDYWGPYRTSQERQSADRAYNDAVLKFSVDKPYQEIFVFDKTPTENRKTRIAKLKERTADEHNGYYCAYLPESQLPRLQFIIVDDEVLLHGFDGESTSVRCAIRNPEFARLFRAYYTRLWHKATKLKDDTGPKRAKLAKFIAELERPVPSPPAS